MPKSWSTYPMLHDQVSSLLENDGLSFSFHAFDDTMGAIRDYDTHIMGRFTCRNKRCSSSGWSSKKIAMTIRLYAGNQYNARVYHQRCERCSSISKPTLDDSYAQRVAYRLKKWHGIELEPPPHSSQSKGPHQSALCEGCRDGHCREGF